MTPRSLSHGGSAAAAAAADRLLLRTDFAWEFLRRNPHYRRIARARSGSALEATFARPWGLWFLADPEVAAPNRAVFWRPEAAPAHVIRLEPVSSAGLEGADLCFDAQAERRSGDGVHLRFGCGLQGFLPRGDAARPLAAVLPISGRFSAALRAAGALERQLRGEPPQPDLTPQQRLRLARTLRAVDAAEAQATYRQIARDLFGQEAVDRHDWRTSSVRDSVIRLVRSGRALVAGGYRRLLRGADAASPPGRPAP